MARRSKMTRPITLACTSVLHDRRATDLVMGAMVAPVEMKDPFGDQVVVLRSLRDDPLAGMFARRQIDQAQYDAGREWQRLTEKTEIGNVKAIDPTKEAVDGGRFPELYREGAARAARDLAHAHATLGMIGESIVKDILGSRLTIKQSGARRGYTSKAEIEFMGQRFREALNTLAEVFGCATGGR